MQPQILQLNIILRTPLLPPMRLIFFFRLRLQHTFHPCRPNNLFLLRRKTRFVNRQTQIPPGIDLRVGGALVIIEEREHLDLAEGTGLVDAGLEDDGAADGSADVEVEVEAVVVCYFQWVFGGGGIGWREGVPWTSIEDDS